MQGDLGVQQPSRGGTEGGPGGLAVHAQSLADKARQPTGEKRGQPHDFRAADSQGQSQREGRHDWIDECLGECADRRQQGGLARWGQQKPC